MTPVNNKSLLHFIFEQMEKLDKKEIDIETAKAQASLSKQANNMLRYELEKAKTEIKIREFNLQNNTSLFINNIENND